ncbi:MAG: 2,3-bisphosphoglycerate-independent phosphoglycerate mutase [Porticoccaceae bacterium]|jgi:2,3-bisphosphoglycerate-independent phosphoglycerate mutase|tara:strand:+ start:3019 stop:4563 length:1545 start_codon:yes stop_codon:yes gene_type:complete
MNVKRKPLVLVILDGCGHSDDKQYNAVANADRPVWENLWHDGHPSTLIGTSGLAVGLPDGQMGNSEVGHMTIGAGRVIYQNFTRINKALDDGDFDSNPAYCDAIDDTVVNDKAVHIFGLLSKGGVHGHEDHINAMIELAVKRGSKRVYLHAFLDGRDCPPRSAKASLEKTHQLCKASGVAKIASVIGRFYAMDRDNRWERTSQAYRLITEGFADYCAKTPMDALDTAYARGENDEFVSATCICEEGATPTVLDDGDAVIFMNFRPDRARQISHAIVDTDFTGFDRFVVRKPSHFVMTTEYEANLNCPCAFPPIPIINSLGEFLSKQKKRQLRIAETEKYAHVTFFLSGGREASYDGEERMLLPSPKVATYDLQPEMSAPQVTERLIEAIESGHFDAIICNYANCDMVGHTGDYNAAMQSVDAVDECLQKVLASLRQVGGEALITADHGNVELMFDSAINQPHTQHTTLPVPLVYVGDRTLKLSEGGSLADIAPTMLALMDLSKPAEMSGRSLIE